MALMTIGDFSRAVRLSAKALRFYHREGVLVPAQVAADTGYRLYTPEQIPDGQIVRTLRGLDVPLDAVRDVLQAPDVAGRASLIAAHLARMEDKLDQTRAAVASLRAMLEPAAAPIEIEHRSIPATRAVAVRERLDLPELRRWFRRSVATLEAVASDARAGSAGRIGGMFSDDLFAEERGIALLFLEIGDGFDTADLPSGVRPVVLPPVELAVATHRGADAGVPGVYAALGEHVARHELRIDAPVREIYIEGFPGIDAETVTEIGWPIFRVAR